MFVKVYSPLVGILLHKKVSIVKMTELGKIHFSLGEALGREVHAVSVSWTYCQQWLQFGTFRLPHFKLIAFSSTRTM